MQQQGLLQGEPILEDGFTDLKHNTKTSGCSNPPLGKRTSPHAFGAGTARAREQPQNWPPKLSR
eukprot:9061933-Alexandrium_andersonii.AAC.1